MPRGRPRFQYDYERAKKLYESGLTMREIANRRPRISQMTLWNGLQRVGTKMRPRGVPPLCNPKEVAAHYQAGVAVRQLAKDYGVSEKTIYNYLKEAGVAKQERPRKDHRNAYVMELTGQGKSVRQVAAIVGVSPARVHQIIKRERGRAGQTPGN